MLQTINSSHRIFEELSGSSKEALKAAKALNSMLTKVRAAGLAPSGNEARVEPSRSVPNGSYGTSTPGESLGLSLMNVWITDVSINLGFGSARQESQNIQLQEPSNCPPTRMPLSNSISDHFPFSC
jgi:hypothetical protein